MDRTIYKDKTTGISLMERGDKNTITISDLGQLTPTEITNLQEIIKRVVPECTVEFNMVQEFEVNGNFYSSRESALWDWVEETFTNIPYILYASSFPIRITSSKNFKDDATRNTDRTRVEVASLGELTEALYSRPYLHEVEFVDGPEAREELLRFHKEMLRKKGLKDENRTIVFK